MLTIDLKRDLKQYYRPSASIPEIVDVPPLHYLTVSGESAPGDDPFQAAMSAIFTMAYSLKFAAKRELDLQYSVMPPEGLYWIPGGKPLVTLEEAGGHLSWKLISLVPDAISPEFVEHVRAEAVEAKGNAPFIGDVRLETIAEGPSVQVMHIGSYATEPETVEKMRLYAEEHGYEFSGAHHEVYLGDPRRSVPEKLKTVLRYPVHAVHELH